MYAMQIYFLLLRATPVRKQWNHFQSQPCSQGLSSCGKTKDPGNEVVSKSAVKIWRLENKMLLEWKLLIFQPRGESCASYFTVFSQKKTESTKYGVVKAKVLWRKFLYSINIFAYYQTTSQNVASTINNRNPQAKGKFWNRCNIKNKIYKNR